MKLYRVTPSEYDYDEYEEFIVYARSPEEAHEMIVKRPNGCSNFLKKCNH